jgi:hypothetical protein
MYPRTQEEEAISGYEVIVTPMDPHGPERRLPPLGRQAANKLALACKKANSRWLVEIAHNNVRTCQ